MHTKVAKTRLMARFERILEALANELVESTDEEILQAAKDLGMNPAMRGSAAYIGLKYPSTPRTSDFFEMPVFRPQQIRAESTPPKAPKSGKRLPSRRKRRKPPHQGSKSESD
jgi:hypothetical protein